MNWNPKIHKVELGLSEIVYIVHYGPNAYSCHYHTEIVESISKSQIKLLMKLLIELNVGELLPCSCTLTTNAGVDIHTKEDSFYSFIRKLRYDTSKLLRDNLEIDYKKANK